MTMTTHTCRHRDYILIELSKGRYAKIDRVDDNRISKWKWCTFTARGGAVYACRGEKSVAGHKTILMHREIIGALSGQRVDHINGDGLDNRRENLRIATPSQNNANRKKTRGLFKGVSWHIRKNAWRAAIGSEGKVQHLGYYRTAEEAAEAYDRAARRLYGQFARVNFPEDGERKAL